MQLGYPTESFELSAEPLDVPGFADLQVDEIAVAGSHSCARAEGRVFCWGANDFYQLATNDGEAGAVTEIDLPEEAESLIAGVDFACALTASKRVLCWGSNEYGERGVAEATVEPNLLPLTSAIGAFGGQGSHWCAWGEGARVSCLGKNNRGQLGNGTTTAALSPTYLEPVIHSQRCEQ
jgi:alpha-tubulin suppressor-like RCC1 family protein